MPIAGYTDDAADLTIVEGRIRMGRVTLPPRIVLVSREHEEQVRTLVHEAHRQCVVANSAQLEEAERLETG